MVKVYNRRAHDVHEPYIPVIWAMNETLISVHNTYIYTLQQ